MQSRLLHALTVQTRGFKRLAAWPRDVAASFVGQPERGQPISSTCGAGGWKRSGFSMVELILVLLVIVFMAALVWPSLDGMLADYRLTQAAESVRARWAAARIRAVDEGRAYQFTWSSEEGQYRLTPVESATSGGVGSVMRPSGVSPSPANEPGIEEALAEGLRFGPAPQMAEATGLVGNMQPAAREAGFAAGETSALSGTIFFYPDGTTSDAVLVINDARDWSVELKLRGLTGVISVSETRPGNGER